jgi:hypothetical protein
MNVVRREDNSTMPLSSMVARVSVKIDETNCFDFDMLMSVNAMPYLNPQESRPVLWDMQCQLQTGSNSSS